MVQLHALKTSIPLVLAFAVFYFWLAAMSPIYWWGGAPYWAGMSLLGGGLTGYLIQRWRQL